MSVQLTERPVESERKPSRVKHIRLPHDPNVAYCGARKTPGSRRRYWRDVSEADVCVVCLSFPGAREYAMGAS